MTPTRQRSPWLIPLLSLVALLAAAGLGVGLFVLLRGGPSTTSPATGEIFLQAASEVGQNPFTTTVASTPAATPRPSPSPSPRQSPTPTAQGVASVIASTPGLYGGTNRLGSCNSQQLVAFLRQNPAKAAAWVAALNADPTLRWSGGTQVRADQIPQYVAELTPVVLRYDTRVTNHGFVNGAANAYQAVLQAGTAVLVDRYGTPRARCACGNPLTPPKPVPTSPTYTGTPWSGFSPTTVIVVTPPATVINVIVLVDFQTGGMFGRPTGTNGESDQPTSGGEQSPQPSLTPPPDVTLGQGDVQVTLLWTSDSDLDLHVVDPSSEEIFFGHDHSASGGILDHDEIPGCGSASTTHVENVYWPQGAAPSGSYQAFVENFGPCGTAAPYELRVTVDGRVTSDTRGELPAEPDSRSTPETFSR